jgi:RND superfamily putative drug exporter
MMHFLGKANWWMPKWLDRIVPHLAVEASNED